MACPLTGKPLHLLPLAQAEAELSKGEPLVTRAVQTPRPVVRTATVLVGEDGACAYPILDGIPFFSALNDSLLATSHSPST
jgi:uncharacterized protein YbaR (Trm112 family)